MSSVVSITRGLKQSLHEDIFINSLPAHQIRSLRISAHLKEYSKCRFVPPRPEAHIREDIERFLQMVESCNCQGMRRNIGLIRCRCNRLMHMVTMEVGDNPDRYSSEQTQQIDGALQRLQEKCKS